jgi:hypothetical protein
MGVGQLIDKLFGGEGVRGQAVLRAYGKLPFYAEYRRLEVAPGAPTAFSQWMDAGRLAWVRSPAKSAAGATRASRMLVGLPDTKEAIVASMWDSRDSLGRAFPFAFFVVSPLESLGSDAVERWVAASLIHRSFDQLYARLHSLGSGGDFYRLYRKHMITLRPDDLGERARALREDAARIMAEPWFKALSLDGEVAPSAWFTGLLRRAERWKSQPSGLANMAVSCPLALGLAYGAQVVLWLEWFGGLSKKGGRMPWVVLPLENEPSAPTLNLVMRDLLPDDYQLLTTDDRAYGYVESLASPPPAAEGGGPPPSDPPTGPVLTWFKEHAL